MLREALAEIFEADAEGGNGLFRGSFDALAGVGHREHHRAVVATARGHVEDPTGPAVGQFRVVRGGSWGSPAGVCRSAVRDWGAPAFNPSQLGFRVALAFAAPVAEK